MLVEALVVGLDIDFARSIIAVIHEMYFKTPTTYPFAFLILSYLPTVGTLE